MPRARHPPPDVAGALVAVAPLVTRWIERLLATHDPPLTVPQYLALRSIAHERLLGSDLARRTGVSEAAVSQLLASLADAQLIERTPASNDRRRQQLGLSSAGERTLRSSTILLRNQLSRLLADLPGADADALARSLPHVERLLGGTAPPRRPPPPPSPTGHAREGA